MRKFFRGFIYAFRGILMVTHERNMRFHLVVAWIVLVAGIYFRITREEWIAILTCFALVMTAETMNTALEESCNVSRDVLGAPYSATGKARDLSAGAVLISAVISAIVGALVFWPYIWPLCGFVIPA